MNIHKNARLTPLRREEMALAVIEGGLSKAHAARMYGVSAKIVARWVERYRAEGSAGMVDRSSRPHVMPGMTRQDVAERIVALRRQRLTGKHIAVAVGVSPATVSRVLRRAGLSRLKDLEPAEPVRRYEHETPGEMIHIDIKKLGRFERVGHRITGDRTARQSPRHRLGIRPRLHRRCLPHRLLADPARREAWKAPSPSSRPRVAYYASLGVAVARVMTDNGSCYRSKAFARPAVTSASSISGPGPIRPRPMARPNASSRPRYGNGPMPSPIHTSDHRAARAARLAAPLQLASPARQPKIQNSQSVASA